MITGVRDFKDFFENTDPSFMSRITIYVGYYNYVNSIPIDTAKFQTIRDWSPLFSYTIDIKNLYPNLECGNLVLGERDYFSMQEDKTISKSQLRKIHTLRDNYNRYLIDLGYSKEEAKEISRYKYELEVLVQNE